MLHEMITNDNKVIMSEKMSIFGGVVKPPSTDAVQKSQSQYFRTKIYIVSMSVTTVFFHVISKVSAAIAKMDIFKMSVF